MYLSFYGLDEKPFATTPDPRFLYLTPGHQEALAHLVYGVKDNTAFLVLTGEVGTGKTSLLQALLNQLDGNTRVAVIVNSGLSFDGILEYMLEEFGIPTPGASRAQRLIALQRFLVERARVGQSVVLILDEAHHLDPGTLEQIRLLSNFEGPTQKHLQIVLVGQPELKATLALPELRQLQQRITLRAVIPPLSSKETREYIRRRLETAGARDLDLFTERAISHIAAYSGGIPRIVNVVCDHGLLIGYADQRRRLDIDVAERAVRYLEDGAEQPKAHHGVNGHRWLSGRRFAGPRPSRTASLRQRGSRTRPSMQSREASRRLLRIGTPTASLTVLVATILFLWPFEGEGLFAGIVGWVSKVEATFRRATPQARPLGVLVGAEMRRTTRTEPRATNAPSPPAGSGSGQPPEVRPPGPAKSVPTTAMQIIPLLPAPSASLPETPRATTRPESPKPQAKIAAPSRSPAPASARDPLATPAQVRPAGTVSSRELARPTESTRLQDGNRSQGTDAPDPSTVIDWLLTKTRREPWP
jgi:general secretion pathway protein A